MQIYDVGDGSARIRWLVVGAFTPEPRGRTHCVRKGELAEAMAAAQLRATVEVADRLGSEDSRTFELSIANLSEFKLDGVVKGVPALAALRALANDLGSANPQQRPGAEEAIARIVEVVGDGILASTLSEQLSTGGAPPPSPGAPRRPPDNDARAEAESADAASSVDRIFSQVDVENASQRACSAVGAFVRSMREGQGGGGAYRIPSSQARKVRDTIEDAVYASAADILRHPAVAALEGAWRGVKLVLDQAPSREEVEVVLLDVAPQALPSAIEEVLPDDIETWPDAVFVLEACEDLATLVSLSEMAEGLNVPVVTALTQDTLAALLASKGSHEGIVPEGWQTLREAPASRWLSVCANRVVLACEGVGTARRVVFASPSLVAAATLTASYRDSGSFGRVFGKQAALRMPATWQPDSGPAAGVMLPVESFVSIDAQNNLSELGIAVLGSGRNSDQVRLARWPTVHQSADAVPMPAQVITGRIVRFAQWVRDQLPPGVSNDDVERIFQDAASVFLFGGVSQGVEIGASLELEEGHPPQLKVAARIHPALASVPLTLVFALPLRS